MAFNENQTVIYELVQIFVKSKECLAHLRTYVKQDSLVMRDAIGHDWGGLKVNATYDIIASPGNPKGTNALFGEIETYLTNNIETIFPLSSDLSRAGIRKLVHYVLMPEVLRYGVAVETSHYNLAPNVIRDIVWYGYDHLVSVIAKCGNGDKTQTHTSTSDLKSTATIVSNKENMNAVFSGKSALNCNADSNLIVIASVVAPVVLTTEGNLLKKTVYMTGVETCGINSQCEYAEKAQSVTPSTDPEATAQVSSRNQNANSGKFEININVNGDGGVTVNGADAVPIVLPAKNMIAREKISKNRSATKRKFCCLPWHNTEKTSTSKDYVQLNNLGVGMR
ncbi:uncharacterized protein LOC116927551 isoform X2 [Daphnia magna]|uniref:uncharacterized protein LOC116927551 isoform X2 n=1 Tax=Daphnia magna TaxID=35525 RepID=UPI001E1BC384|nr:uncharacterized protein LOC116927551 isoform X2 [Daphnia magna]